jgi:hypothetical protein
MQVACGSFAAAVSAARTSQSGRQRQFAVQFRRHRASLDPVQTLTNGSYAVVEFGMPPLYRAILGPLSAARQLKLPMCY